MSQAEPVEPRGWLARLRGGLSRSSARLSEGINAIFLRRRLDDAALGELEDLLIASTAGGRGSLYDRGAVVGQDPASRSLGGLMSARVSSCSRWSMALRRLQRRAGCPW